MNTSPPDRGNRLAPSGPAVPARISVPGGSPLRVRPADDDDLPELHRLDQAVFRALAYPYFVLRQLYDLHREDLLVLDDGRGLRGYVLAPATSDRSRSWVLGLAVDQQWRGNGLGRKLMTESLRSLRSRGVREVWLTVEPANAAAIDLYTSLGFVRVEHRQDYFGPDGDRLLMMLEFAR